MKYELIDAKLSDIDILKKWKRETIFEYAKELTVQEKEKIINYINETTPKYLNDYKIICVKNIKVGSVLIYRYEDGYLFDELYLEDKYRNKGIGTDIFTNMIKIYKTIYLWVYKENVKAINLYKRLEFKIIKETDTRYFMKY